ncbi:5prime-3prime exoribonuclease 1 [Diplonema papillatum]|nr:5prime-3prime exoribonuclease 1 [Diplonema papillatum]
MGVQGLKRTLQDRYGRCVNMVSTTPRSGGGRVEVDHLCVDMNSVMHGCVGKASQTQREALDQIVECLDSLLAVTDPKLSVILAVDGAAPLAKVPLQRGRRRQMAVSLTREVGLHTAHKLHLTPGTEFLKDVTQLLVAWSRKLVEERGLRVVVSGDDTPGEGECKIFEYLRDSLAAGTCAPNQSYCIVGNDSDLFVGALCLLPLLNVAILDFHTGFCVTLPEFLFQLINTGSTAFSLTDGSNPTPGKCFVRDMSAMPHHRLAFAFLAIFAGNDYLPSVEGADAHKLWVTYSEFMLSTEASDHLITLSHPADAAKPAKGRAAVRPPACQLRLPVLGRVLAKFFKDGKRPLPGPGEAEGEVRARVLGYLQGVMWCMEALCGEGCRDIAYTYNLSDRQNSANEPGPNVRDILAVCLSVGSGSGKHDRRPTPGAGSVVSPVSDTQPLPPLKYLAAVLPLEAYWMLPPSVSQLVNSVTEHANGGRSTKKAGRGAPPASEALTLAIMNLSDTPAPSTIVESLHTIFSAPALLSTLPPAASKRLLHQPAVSVEKGAASAGSPPPAKKRKKAQAADAVAVRPYEKPRFVPLVELLADEALQVARNVKNPFTLVDWEFPAPMAPAGGGKTKKKKVPTGKKLASAVEMDEEV